MRRFLNNVTHTVFLMLGPRCNLRCRYCLQQPLRRDREPEAPHPDVIAFLKELAAEQEQPFTVQFYGGEPLMYPEQMRAVADALEGKPGIRFSMISNGLLIDEATAAWLDAHDFGVGVSWDGPRTAEVRGVDVFADPERRARILSLANLSLSSVVSARNYPLETMDALPELDREREARAGKSLMVNFDEIMDTGLGDCGLLNVDCGRVRMEMEMVAAETEKLLAGRPCNPWYGHLGRRYLDRLKKGVEGRETYRRGACACGNGRFVLNLDLQGNLYRCHNSDQRLGSIRDDYHHYLENVMLHDPMREYSAACLECPVAGMCGGGCPLLGPDVRANGYCDLKKAMFLPFVALALRLGGGSGKMDGKGDVA